LWGVDFTIMLYFDVYSEKGFFTALFLFLQGYAYHALPHGFTRGVHSGFCRSGGHCSHLCLKIAHRGTRAFVPDAMFVL
jgi:hypothetical protein